MPVPVFPKDPLFQTALGLLRAGGLALAPSALADGVWWVDIQLWGARAYGLTLERWDLTAHGLDLPSLAPLRQGHLPVTWAPWMTLTASGVVPSRESLCWALDDLCPRVGAYIATAAETGAARWAGDRAEWSYQAAEQDLESPLTVESILALTGHPPAEWARLAESYTEQRALADAFKPPHP